MPNLAELLEEDEEAGGDGAAAASRKSDGAALLRASERASVGSGLAAAGGGSPPHKYLKQGERQGKWYGGMQGCFYEGNGPWVQRSKSCTASWPALPHRCRDRGLWPVAHCPCPPAAESEEGGELDGAMPPPPRPSSVAEGDMGVLQARVRELQTQVRRPGCGGTSCWQLLHASVQQLQLPAARCWAACPAGSLHRAALALTCTQTFRPAPMPACSRACPAERPNAAGAGPHERAGSPPGAAAQVSAGSAAAASVAAAAALTAALLCA